MNELALPMPKFALACYESVPENRLVGSCSEMLDVMLGIRNQHLFDELGCACQKYAPRPNAEARERAIVSGRFEQEVEQTGAELADVATDQRALRSRRQSRADGRGRGIHIQIYRFLMVPEAPKRPLLAQSGYPISRRDVRLWHLADINVCTQYVRF